MRTTLYIALCIMFVTSSPLVLAQTLHSNQATSIRYSSDTPLPPFAVGDQRDWSAQDLEMLDTARNETNLSEREKNMIREVNYVRAYPTKYAALLSEYIQTRENIAQFFPTLADEMKDTITETRLLMEELKKIPAMGTLKSLACIHEAAKNQGKYLKDTHSFGHMGLNNSTPNSRITQSCLASSIQFQGTGENLVFGSYTSIREALMSLLVDYGVEGRGHRYNILDRRWTYIGVGQFGEFIEGQQDSGWVQDFGVN